MPENYPEVTVILQGTYTVLRLRSTGEIEALWGSVPPGLKPEAILFADEMPASAERWIDEALPPYAREYMMEPMANPTVRISDVRARRFNLIDRLPQFFDVSWVRNPVDLHTRIPINITHQQKAVFVIEERVKWGKVPLETCRHGLLLMMVERMKTAPPLVWDYILDDDDAFDSV